MNPSIAQKKVQELLEQNKCLIVMVGVPGSGKSTFIRKFTDIVIASTDDLIEAAAKKRGKTYSEVFDSMNFKYLKHEMKKTIDKAIEDQAHLAIDRTNMSVKSRKEFIGYADGYTKICLNFSIDDDVLKKRLQARAEATGKIIPQFVLSNMLKSYQTPTKSEGFDYIFEIDNS